MQPTESNFDLLYIILIAFGVVFVASVVMAVWVVLSVDKIKLPANADFWETLRVTPLSVVNVEASEKYNRSAALGFLYMSLPLVMQNHFRGDWAPGDYSEVSF